MLMSCLIIPIQNIHTAALFSMVLLMVIFTRTQQYSGFNGGGLTRTLETLHVYACDGNYARVVCPLRTVIIIQYAKYGRSVSSTMMCGSDKQRSATANVELHGDMPLIEDTNCIAVRSLEVMLDLCEDRPSCAVKASPETFTQDPCVGTSKYIEAHYKCRPNEFDRKTACEGEELIISCASGDRITVYSAMYGQTPNGTDQCRPNQQGYIDCQATGAFSKVSSLCQSRRKCSVKANESVFGDPCASGINKYLTVSYACVPKRILKQLPHQAVNKKRKKKKKKKKGKRKGKINDKVPEVTTETEEPVASPVTQPSGHHIHHPSKPEVLESVEQQTVTQVLPKSERDPSSDGGSRFQEAEDVTSEGQDITTSHPWPRNKVVTPAPTMPGITGDLLVPRTGLGAVSNAEGTRISSTIQTTDLLHLSFNQKNNKDLNSEYNTNYNNGNDNNQKTNNNENGQEYGDNEDSNNNHITENNGSQHSGPRTNKGQIGQIRINDPDTHPTDNSPAVDTSLKSGSTKNSKSQGSKSAAYPTRNPNSSSSREKTIPESPFVTERNLTVLCMNYTRPNVQWGGIIKPKDERTIGFLRDWFSAMYFLQMHQEKAWLYFTLGICLGIIVMLVVVLIKVCINFRRNIRARLDVSEPTHRSAHTHNHSSLDAPMLEHSDSIDQIEVVRFSPRSTLRSHRSNSHHRDLVNYYG